MFHEIKVLNHPAIEVLPPLGEPPFCESLDHPFLGILAGAYGPAGKDHVPGRGQRNPQGANGGLGLP